MDRSTITGIAVAFCAIGAGLVLEGGRLAQILQPTAAIVVFGGTLGAVLVQFPLPILIQALRESHSVVVYRAPQTELLVKSLLRFSHRVRREGIVSLDPELAGIQDPFLRECLTLAVDGMSIPDLRKMMNLKLDERAEKEERIPKVFEAAAGFAPTIGILGAVLGLIQVMQQLQDMEAVGKGIAAAFVSTLYGVGAANLLFLPCAGKLKIRLRDRQIVEEMILNGVLSIMEGVNPRALERQLATSLPRRDLERQGPRELVRTAASR